MSYRTFSEILLGQQIDLLRIEKLITKYGEDWKVFLDDLPGFIHLNKKQKILVDFVNKTAMNEIGFSNTELNELGYDYQLNHLDPYYTLHYTSKKLIPFIEKDIENRLFSFSQGFRKREEKQFNLIYTVSKPLRNSDCLISYSLPFYNIEVASSKVQKLLAEYKFVHKNFLKFQQLTDREMDILKLIVLGKTNIDISEQLLITTDTVKQHRKMIKRKTECRSIVELIKFAQAFDLI